MAAKHPNEPGGDADVLEEGKLPVVEEQSTEPMQAGTSLAVQVARAEIDQAVATAKSFPRSLSRAKSLIMELANLDEETAEECMYALPRGNKPIKGPSIRFAEIAVSSYGNCQSAARTTHIDHDFVEAEGVFYDMENNVRRVRRVRRSILTKEGRRYNADMINVTCNAACSIAERNAILGGIPKALWRPAFDKVHATIAGTVQTLTVKREKALKEFAKYGVTTEQVFALMHVKEAEKIGVDDIPTLRGILSALKNGEETVESIFNPRALAAGKQFKKVENPMGNKTNGEKTGGAAAKSSRGGKSSGGEGEPKDSSGSAAQAGEGAPSATAAPQPSVTPKTAEEYIGHAKANAAAANNADALAAWFTSKKEKDLRNACDVMVDQATEIRKTIIDPRVNELRK